MRLISVDELKEWVKNWFDVNRNYHPYSKQNNIPIPELYDILERMPTIEERKTGRWIIQDNPGTGWYRVVCSECDENVTSNIPMIGFFPHCKPLWDYCPNCGADMRGEGHE